VAPCEGPGVRDCFIVRPGPTTRLFEPTGLGGTGCDPDESNISPWFCFVNQFLTAYFVRAGGAGLGIAAAMRPGN
jgi:hypothetical protein